MHWSEKRLRAAVMESRAWTSPRYAMHDRPWHGQGGGCDIAPAAEPMTVDRTLTNCIRR